MFCLSHSVIMLRPKHFRIFSKSSYHFFLFLSNFRPRNISISPSTLYKSIFNHHIITPLSRGLREIRNCSPDALLQACILIVRVIARTTLIVKKTTSVGGKCLNVRRTLRFPVFSSKTFNVSFLRFIRESDSWRRKTFCSERTERNKISRSSASAWSDVKSSRWRKLKSTLSSSFVSLPLCKPFVASYCYH